MDTGQLHQTFPPTKLYNHKVAMYCIMDKIDTVSILSDSQLFFRGCIITFILII